MTHISKVLLGAIALTLGLSGPSNAVDDSVKPIVIGGGFPHAAKRAIDYCDGWIPILGTYGGSLTALIIAGILLLLLKYKNYYYPSLLLIILISSLLNFKITSNGVVPPNSVSINFMP